MDKKEKLFFWGAALNIASVGTGVGGMMQASGQAKEAAEQAERQESLMKQQTKALNKLATQNPAAGPQVAQIMASEGSIMSKEFTMVEQPANPNRTQTEIDSQNSLQDAGTSLNTGLKTAGGLATGAIVGGLGGGLIGGVNGFRGANPGTWNRTKGFAKGNIKGSLIGAGIGMVAGGLLGHESGNNDRSHQIRNYSFIGEAGKFAKTVGKYALDNKGELAKQVVIWGAVPAVAAYGIDKAITHDAKKNGIMPQQVAAAQQAPQQGSYSSIMNDSERLFAAANGSVMSGVKNWAKDIWKNDKGMLAMSGVFAAIPGVTYLAQRNSMKQQVQDTQQSIMNNNTPRQQNYSVMDERAFAFGARITGMRKTIDKTMGFLGGGSEVIKKAGNSISEIGKKYNSEWAQKMGKSIMEHPVRWGVGGAAAATGIMMGTAAVGEKIIRKPLETVDKNAFEYEKAQNQIV